MWVASLRRRVSTIIVDALTVLVFGVVSAHACDVRVERVSVVAPAYDPFGPSQGAGRLQGFVSATGEGACDIEAFVSDESGGALKSIALGAKLSLSVQGEEAGPAWSDGDPSRLRLSLTTGAAPVVLSFALPVASTGVLAPGVYEKAVSLVARPIRGGAQGEGRGVLSFSAPARAQMNIAGVSGPFGGGAIAGVEFGVLRTGDIRRVFLQVRANTGARVQLRSRNGGVLVHAQQPINAFIDYDVIVDGRRFDLDGPTSVDFAPPLDATGVSAPMDIVIGEVGGKPAGRYSDIIDVDISPR
jgi:hypothetical protein